MSLIACCNGQRAFGNACNSLVSAKMEENAIAGLPQTPWHLPRDLREHPQTPKQTPRDLREYPQTPRQTPRDLREYPQTPKQTPQDLREYPQTPKSSPKHLSQRCRHFQKRFGQASVETLCWFYSYTELTLIRNYEAVSRRKRGSIGNGGAVLCPLIPRSSAAGLRSC